MCLRSMIGTNLNLGRSPLNINSFKELGSHQLLSMLHFLYTLLFTFANRTFY